MRFKRENTYGMPARILTNADYGRLMQEAHDYSAANRQPGQHDRPLEHTHWAVCRDCETHPMPRSGSNIEPAAPDGPAVSTLVPKTQEWSLTHASDGPEHLPNALCAYIRRWPLMPSGNAPRLTASRVAPKRAHQPFLLGIRTVRLRGSSSEERAEGVAAFRSVAEQLLAALP